MSPAQTAASALDISVDDIVATTPIKHGLTNESWLVRTRTDVVVVRLSTTHEDALRIDRASEARILTVVADAGIGAPIIKCDPAQRVLVTRYLGPSWSYEDAQHDHNVRKLASLLRTLHQLDAPLGVRTVDLGETVEGYLATLTEHGAHRGLTTQTLRNRAAAAAHVLQKESIARLCHNDVHHLNIVDGGGELRLIDWEYAGAGEPLFDLASACVYHRYEAAQRALLISSWSATADSALQARLDLAIWLFEYVKELWEAVRAMSRSC